MSPPIWGYYFLTFMVTGTVAILLLSMISTAGAITGVGVVEEVREELLLLSLLNVFFMIDLGEEGDVDEDGNEEEDNEDLAGGAVEATDSHAEWFDVAPVVIPVISLCALLVDVVVGG